jgi:hypothetical protein
MARFHFQVPEETVAAEFTLLQEECTSFLEAVERKTLGSDIRFNVWFDKKDSTLYIDSSDIEIVISKNGQGILRARKLTPNS